ncbi:MAG TPA: tetratricopeptide repeat protein [Chthonomonadaceae bacterium]|nr:tetratricopeptide repeat protein [Chthonomonadaceae bacterium]
MVARTLWCAIALVLLVRAGYCQQASQGGFVISSQGTPEDMRSLNAVLDQARGYVEKGQEALAAKKYGRAESLFLNALAAWPGMEQAQMGLVNTYELQGKKDRAADALRRLIHKKDPGSIAGDPRTLLKCALLLSGLREWEEAVDMYERALASPVLNLQRLSSLTIHFRPDVWDIRKMQMAAHMVLGIASLGNHPVPTDEDIAHLRRAIKLQPSSALAHLYLGFGLEWAGKPEEAEAEASYNRAAELAVKEPPVRAKALQFLDEIHYQRAANALSARIESKR